MMEYSLAMFFRPKGCFGACNSGARHLIFQVMLLIEIVRGVYALRSGSQ